MDLLNYSQLTWAELVAKLQLNPPDPGAWETALSKLRELAAAVLRNYPVFQPEAVEEIACEVVIRLLSADRHVGDALQIIKTVSSPQAYLAAMIRNAAITQLRRRRLEQKAIKRLAELTRGHEAERAAADTPWFWAEDSEHLNRRLHQLSTAEREMLRLRFWESLPISEIASRMHLTYSATAVRLFRLLRKVRGLLLHPEEPPT